MLTPEQLAGGSEDSQCVALMAWVALNIKQYPNLKWLTHVPNGGARDLREGAKFKAMGVRRGFPDYFLPVKSNWKMGSGWVEYRYPGLFIEMKVGKNKISSEQDSWLAYLTSEGYQCHVCYGWEEARDKILEYLNG